MKQWLIAMIAAALVGGAATAQEVKTKTGGIIVKKVIKNGKVVDENVEVFGDLDDDEIEKHLGRMKKLDVKKLKKLGKSKAGAHGKKHVRVFKWRSDDDDDVSVDFDFDFGGHDFGESVRKHVHKSLKGALEGLGENLGSELEVVIRGLGKKLHGHLGRALEELDDVEIDVEDLGELKKHLKGMNRRFKDAEKHFDKAMKKFRKHGMRWKFGDKAIHLGPGRTFHLFGDGDLDVEAKVRKKIEGLRKGDTNVEVWVEKGDGKPRKLRKVIRKRLRADDAAESKTQRKRMRVERSDKDGDAAIRRLQRQVRELQKELDALRRQSGVRAKKTAVWL